MDPHSCGGLQRVYQGNFSARLGNDQNNSRAEGLYYTFTVTPLTTLVQYAYAVVLQDPGHDDGAQPRFQSRVRLANGSIIPCTEYVVTAGPNLPGYNYCNENDIFGNPVQVAYSDWRVISLDLSAYVGQSVRLEFETGDCDLGAHYGYAYIDAISCGPIETEVYYCQASDSILIAAPEGFATYEWTPTGATTRLITVSNNEYDTLYCRVTTITGCELTLEVILSPIPLFANIACENACLNDLTFLENLTPVFPEYPTGYQWSFGDGNTSIAYQPSHLYTQPGTYIVTMSATVLGTTCTDQDQCEVTVYPIPYLNTIWHD